MHTSPAPRTRNGTEIVKAKNCTTLSIMPGILTGISSLQDVLRSLLQSACHFLTTSELRANGRMSALFVPAGAVTTNLNPFGSVSAYLKLMPLCHWNSAQVPQAISHSTVKTTHNLSIPTRQFIGGSRKPTCSQTSSARSLSHGPIRVGEGRGSDLTTA
jgi:hypothetical protein